MRGLTLIEVLVLVAIILIICAIALPGLLSSQRASNERGASTTLKTFSSAEADFRANDRDGNGVNDFWTADVKGLYTVIGPDCNLPKRSTLELPVKLIALSAAAADADATMIPAGGKNTPLTSYAVPAPQAGYWYAALIADHSEGAAKADPYKKETKGTPPMGTVHNESKFGFMAFPDRSSSGKYVLIVDENNTIFRSAITTPVRTNEKIPPGLGGINPHYLNWPDLKLLYDGKW